MNLDEPIPGAPESAGPIARGVLPAALALALLAAAVYLPGLNGGFAFDDYGVVVNNQHLALDSGSPTALLDAAFSANTGPLRRPVAMLSFALNRSTTGLDPLPFKIVNVAIHALNSLLVLALLGLLAGALAPAGAGRAPALAWLAAALWAVHPINLTSVLYVVQRMSSLCATFMLIALVAWALMRRRQIAGKPRQRMLIGVIAVATTTALLTKETALMLPVYVAVIECVVFRFQAAGELRRMFLLGVVAVALGGAALLVSAPEVVFGGYDARVFTPLERLLTEARVLVFYLGLIVLPDPSAFSLFHDDIALSRGLTDPPGTALALGALAALVAAAFLSRRRYVAFGVAWYLGGHLLESTVYPLEIAHEHRNYLPSVGIVFALVLAAAEGLGALRARRTSRYVATAALLALAALTALRAGVWAEPERLAAFEARHHPESARTIYELGRLQLERAAATGDPALRAAGIASMERAADMAAIPTLPLAALLNAAASDGDAARIERLVTRLASEPREAVRVDAFEMVVSCQAWRGCAPHPGLVSRLASAILADARLSDAGRRQTVGWLALYYLRVLGDANAALGMLRSLAAEVPDDRALHTRLAEALSAAGQRTEAAAVARRVYAGLPWRSHVTDRALRRRLEAVIAADGDA